MPAPAEGFAPTAKDVYPGISPDKYKGIHDGKVVFITGGGTGLGLAAAKAFIASGAKVFIAGRRAEVLDAAKAQLAEGSKAQVASAVVDVTDEASVKAGVASALKTFGKIDIVVANAGTDGEPGKKLAESDTKDWWGTIESSLKGSYLTAHETIPELVKTKGYIIFLSSILAQIRYPGGSPYNIAKHSLNRLAEYVDFEYGPSGVKSFALHPGGVGATAVGERLDSFVFKGMNFFDQTAELSAWTEVRLTSGSEDWLSGRYIDSTWGLDELAKHKEKILEQDALKNRLAMPI